MDSVIRVSSISEEPLLSTQAGFEVEQIIEGLKGVVCVFDSLRISAGSGESKYAGCEIALLRSVLDYAINELESLLN